MNYSKSLEDKINDIIQNVPKKIVKGNLAYATVIYDNWKQQDFVASSRVHQNITINGIQFSSPSSTDFNYLSVNSEGVVEGELGYERYNDTEAKIFGLIKAMIQNGTFNRGRIFLYTTYIPCISCYYVIDQFRREYPTFSIDVYSHSNFSIQVERKEC
jgi:hypothetical protein